MFIGLQCICVFVANCKKMCERHKKDIFKTSEISVSKKPKTRISLHCGVFNAYIGMITLGKIAQRKNRGL